MNAHTATVMKDKTFVAVFEHASSLYRLQTSRVATAWATTAITTAKDNLTLWHRHVGHLGAANVKHTHRIMNGLNAKFDEASLGLCESCQVTEMLKCVPLV